MAARTAVEESCIAHLPVGVFATVMGLGGWTLATMAVERHLGTGHAASGALLILTSGLFLFLLALYGLKARRHPERVAAEWGDPVQRSFFATITVGLLLIATGILAHRPDIARALWITGAALHLVLTLAIARAWIRKRHAVQHLNPAWFVPAVGNIVVPLAGVGLGQTEVSWFFFATGLFFWLVLSTLVFNRLIFHEPLPERLMPTLVILLAPPAVGHLAWVRLTGEVDAFAILLYDVALFLALLVGSLVRDLVRVPFALSWWAWSFPLAAFAASCLDLAAALDSPFHRGLGAGAYGLLTVVMIGLGVRTLLAARAGALCRPQEAPQKSAAASSSAASSRIR